ncbi:hypothetical protein ONZ45_g17265 [Pleurotus djamor]|nr:hypothetical protein ONZ45_g17265 [Pleurotus djamor]
MPIPSKTQNSLETDNKSIPIVAKPTLWDPIYALAEYDARTSTWYSRPPISGANLSRLLQIHWITIDDIKENCTKEDLAALREFRTYCLKVALDIAGLWPKDKKLIINDRFLGLGDRRLDIGGGATVVRWEDGEYPWRIEWKSREEALPSECLDHIFNVAYSGRREMGSEYDENDDKRICELMGDHVPFSYSRDLFMKSFRHYIAPMDDLWFEQGMQEERNTEGCE